MKEDTLDRLLIAAKELAAAGGHTGLAVVELCRAAATIATAPPFFAVVMQIDLGSRWSVEKKEVADDPNQAEESGEDKPSTASRISACLAISQAADKLRRSGFDAEANSLFTIAALTARSRADEAWAVLEPISRASLAEADRQREDAISEAVNARDAQRMARDAALVAEVPEYFLGVEDQRPPTAEEVPIVITQEQAEAGAEG
jgi:hypothetical protein